MTPSPQPPAVTAAVIRADARALPLPDASVDLICTSPPYFALRDYRDGDGSLAGQIGAEATPQAYVAALLECTREWTRVLKPSGSLWVNLGDKYSQRTATRGSSHQDGLFPGRPELSKDWKRDKERGLTRMPHQNVVGPEGAYVPEKSLMGLPWRYALGCIDDLGLILRAEVIWSKPNGLPESVTDRVRRSHEHWFHLTKAPRYYSAVDEIREAYDQGREATAKRRNGQRVLASHPSTAHNGTLRGVNEDGFRRPYENPLGKLPGSVWEIATQPLKVPDHLNVDHFAAFPSALPMRIIAGWSPPGICTACGEGRRPVVDKPSPLGNVPESSTERVSAPRGRMGSTSTVMLSGSARQKWEQANPLQLTGYACVCPTPDAPTRPALIVDPFGGTGTTALAAKALGRHGLSFDLSHDYARLAQWRTQEPGELARVLGVPKPPVPVTGQIDMFGESA